MHACLAAFCLPVGIMFLATGGLLTADIKGETTREIFYLPLSGPAAFDEAGSLQLVKRELDARGIQYPTGSVHYRVKKGNKELRWSGLNKSLRLVSTGNPRVARLTVKTPDWLRRFVQLHKADGKTPFKIYAAIWAVILFSLFVTGMLMAWQVRKLRTLVIVSTLLGVATFVLLLFQSIWYA